MASIKEQSVYIAEEKLLGGLMKRDCYVVEVIDKLNPDLFSMKEYSNIFEADIRLLRKGIGSLGDRVLDFDTYFVSNMSTFNKVMIDHLNAEKLANKHLFCTKLLPLHKLPNVTEELIPLTFHNIELVMTAASDFQFVQPFACLT